MLQRRGKKIFCHFSKNLSNKFQCQFWLGGRRLSSAWEWVPNGRLDAGGTPIDRKWPNFQAIMPSSREGDALAMKFFDGGGKLSNIPKNLRTCGAICEYNFEKLFEGMHL